MATHYPTSSNFLNGNFPPDGDIEWTWDKYASNDHVDLVNNDRDAKFHQHISNGTAVVRGNKPFLADQHFWEVEMISPVYGTDMMIGVGTPEADVLQVQDRFISFLGMNNHTWGLSYTGLFHHNGRSRGYSPPFGQGSVIGVHLDLWNGTLSYYKNKKHLGIASRGLQGKTLYAMASSTAACSGMRIVSSCSFPSSLQFLCCARLRELIPDEKSVLKELHLPPGLRLFLENNLGWLLDSRHSEVQLYHNRGRRRSQRVSSFLGANQFMFHENNIEIEPPIDPNPDTVDARDTLFVVGSLPYVFSCISRFGRRNLRDRNGQATRPINYVVAEPSPPCPEGTSKDVQDSRTEPEPSHEDSETSTSSEGNEVPLESDSKRRRYSYNYYVGLSDPDSD